MIELQDYLLNDYKKDNEQYKSVESIINKVTNFYMKFSEKDGWPLDLSDEENDYSASTTAMIAFSLEVLKGGQFDFCIDKKCKSYISEKKESNKYLEKLSKSKNLIIKKYCENNNKFISETYGVNDPFTLSWVCFLFKNEKKSSRFEILIKEKISIIEKIYNDIDELKYSNEKKKDNNKKSPIEKTHIFPLLKIIQIYKEYDNETVIDSESKYIESVKQYLNNRLHHHLSLAAIQNSNFDAAELIFSLEGLLLLEDNKDNFDKKIIKKVFEVIKDKQKASLYWRPLKPFVLNEKGLALLPLSVEIAMSLIRICRLLGEYGSNLFSENIEIFNKYTDWIKTRLSKSDKYYGWCSEHIYRPNIVHTWETSQVLVYLVNYNDMLKEHISKKLLRLSQISIKYFKNKKKFKKHDFIKDDPIKYNKNKMCDKTYDDIYEEYIYSRINHSLDKFDKKLIEQSKFKEYIKKYKDEIKIKTISIFTHNYNNKKYSMLLYGPPGTGKSRLAESIAKHLNWSLITITPSDFLASGIDRVEEKAKNIFKVLQEQEDTVIFFDEIDRLILDRESKQYSAQGDMFQFMTPSMLVKINDLRKSEKSIFIIATNYEERIDKAIKRKGRIDKKYLILPFDKYRKEEIIKEKLKIKNLEKVKNLLPHTCFYNYGELIYFVENINITKEEDIDQASITLLSYKDRLNLNKNEDENGYTQLPIKEFISLLDLKKESYKKFDLEEKNLIIEFIYDIMEKEDENNSKSVKEKKEYIQSYKNKLSLKNGYEKYKSLLIDIFEKNLEKEDVYENK